MYARRICTYQPYGISGDILQQYMGAYSCNSVSLLISELLDPLDCGIVEYLICTFFVAARLDGTYNNAVGRHNWCPHLAQSPMIETVADLFVQQTVRVLKANNFLSCAKLYNVGLNVLYVQLVFSTHDPTWGDIPASDCLDT